MRVASCSTVLSARSGDSLPDLDAVAQTLGDLGGTVTRHTDREVAANFGSLLWSRLLGEFWVSRKTLPALVEITKIAGEPTPQLEVTVSDRHRFGFKFGFVGKYERALRELADRVSDALTS